MAQDIDNLYDKLYIEYFKAYTLEKLFKDWQQYSEKHTSRKQKTIAEDFYTYKRYFKGKSIVIKDIRQLKVGDFMKFVDGIFMTNPTRKNVNSVKTLINQLYQQAVREGLTVSSPLNMIDFKHREYKINDHDDEYYTEDETIALISYILGLENKNGIDYAIMFKFCFPIRIGELKGLTWEDVNDIQIYVHQQLDSAGDIVDVKKARRTGHRYYYNPELAIWILEQQDRTGKYVFMHKGKPIKTNDYNDTLKRRCKKAGVTYYSSHKQRFAGCTLMLDNGISLHDTQIAMGQANQTMTEHYNRARERRANLQIKEVYYKHLSRVRTEYATPKVKESP